MRKATINYTDGKEIFYKRPAQCVKIKLIFKKQFFGGVVYKKIRYGNNFAAKEFQVSNN